MRLFQFDFEFLEILEFETRKICCPYHYPLTTAPRCTGTLNEKKCQIVCILYANYVAFLRLYKLVFFHLLSKVQSCREHCF
jgi:hypothetical protein